MLNTEQVEQFNTMFDNLSLICAKKDPTEIERETVSTARDYCNAIIPFSGDLKPALEELKENLGALHDVLSEIQNEQANVNIFASRNGSNPTGISSIIQNINSDENPTPKSNQEVLLRSLKVVVQFKQDFENLVRLYANNIPFADKNGKTSNEIYQMALNEALGMK